MDFLIIGAGIAGLSAAITLQQYGRVLLLLKKDTEGCNTYYAAGGIASSGPWNSDYEGHIRDTLIAGDGLCHQDVVKDIVQKGANYVQQLIDWGVIFDYGKDGKLDLGQEGGHSSRRILHTGRSEERRVGKECRYR